MADITGSVSLRLVGLPNSKALVKVSSAGHSALSAAGPPWHQEVTLPGVECNATDPVVTVELLDPKTKQSQGTVEAHILSAVSAAGKWGPMRVLDFPKGKLLMARWMWMPVDRQAYVLQKYVRKIQAVWRGRRTRQHLEVLKRQRKLLSRRGIEANGSLYLVSCYKTDSGLELLLHGANPEATVKPLLHKVAVSEMDPEAVMSRVTVTPANQLVVAS